LRQSDARKFFVDFQSKTWGQKAAVEKKRRKKAHHLHISTTEYYTLYLHYSHKSQLCKTLSSRLLGYIKRDVVYDNYVSRDEEKSFTDDEYQEELLFVFCFCGGRESFSFVVHIIRSICIGDGVN
jgi:hypothetical protein